MQFALHTKKKHSVHPSVECNIKAIKHFTRCNQILLQSAYAFSITIPFTSISYFSSFKKPSVNNVQLHKHLYLTNKKQFGMCSANNVLPSQSISFAPKNRKNSIICLHWLVKYETSIHSNSICCEMHKMLLAIDALNLYSECICNFYVEWWIKSIFSEYLSGVVLILVMHQWFIFTKFSITTSCMHTKSHFVRSSINLNIAKNSSDRNNSYIMRQII